MIHHLKAGILTHRLDLADHLIHEAFLDQFIGQSCIQHNCDTAVAFGHEALHLCGIDEQIILLENLLLTIKRDRERSLFIQLIHSCIAVQIRQNLLQRIQLLAEPSSQRLQLRLKGIGGEITHIL